MKIVGVSHPIPTKYAERIYNDNKIVFVGKRYLFKVSSGDKFILYESKGAKAYTGQANIKFIGELEPNEILNKYKTKLMLKPKEFKEYAGNRDKMVVIELEDFKKFNKNVYPRKYVPISGKYIYEDEYQFIKENKD